MHRQYKFRSIQKAILNIGLKSLCQFQKYIFGTLSKMSCSQLANLEEPEVAGFVSKTFQILNKNEEFGKIVYWATSGKEFVIRDITKFQEIVLPKYFRHRKINSFIRQLNMYGFHKSRKENSKSIFSHPYFLRGREDLLSSIRRKVKVNDSEPQTPAKCEKGPSFETQGYAKITGTPITLREDISIQQPSCRDINAREFLESKQCLQSRMNLTFNCSLRKLSQSCIGGIIDDDQDQDECLSIENGIESYNSQEKSQFQPSQGHPHQNYQCQSNRQIKFQTPSYFVLPSREQ